MGIFANSGGMACLSHVCANAGTEGLDAACPLVIKFLDSWQTLVAKSHEAKHRFKQTFQISCPWVGNHTRWYCKYDVALVLNPLFYQLSTFLENYQSGHKEKLSSVAACQSIIDSKDPDFILQWYTFIY